MIEKVLMIENILNAKEFPAKLLLRVKSFPVLVDSAFLPDCKFCLHPLFQKCEDLLVIRISQRAVLPSALICLQKLVDVVALFRVLSSCKRSQSLRIIEVIAGILNLIHLVIIQSVRLFQASNALLIRTRHHKRNSEHLIEVGFLQFQIVGEILLPAIREKTVDLRGHTLCGSVRICFLRSIHEHQKQRILNLTVFYLIKIPVQILVERGAVTASIRAQCIKRCQQDHILRREWTIVHLFCHRKIIIVCPFPCCHNNKL